ncbi:MAG: ABC transporter substrate-binding protein [Promethearchaeota archaeon]
MKKGLVLLLVSVMLLGAFMPVLITQAATKQAVVVVLSTGVQTTETLSEMVDDYNDNYAPAGVSVDLQTSTWETQSQHDTYTTKFAVADPGLDVVSMDVIWPPEFIAAGWLEPLDDIINDTNVDDFLPAPVEAGTYQGVHYGVPWFHDSAMLFYRTDILEYASSEGIIPENRAPETWDELHDWTLDMLNDTDLVDMFKGADGILEGFTWQGKQYEGLVCDFMEYLGGTGQYSFLNEDQTAAAFNTTNVRDTLEFMASLLVTHQGPTATDTISVSPIGVLTYNEEPSRTVWNAGNAIFHRNWPYAYRLSMDNAFLNGSEGATDPLFDVAVMPHKAGVTEYRTSCLGGWQLGLSKFSTHKTEAKHFIRWLTAYEQQKTLLIGNGNIPTLEAVYDDDDVLTSDQAYVNVLLPIFKKALPRPVHKDYPEMSAAIWVYLQGAIAPGGTPIDDAIGYLDDTVNEILQRAPPATGIPELAFLALLSISAIVILRRRRKKK